MPSDNDTYPPWVERFDALKLAGKSPQVVPPQPNVPRPLQAGHAPRRSSGGTFVGGFNPLNAGPYGERGPPPPAGGYPVAGGPQARPGPSMPMPVPTVFNTGKSNPSLTMQYAMSAPHDAPTFNRPSPPRPSKLTPVTPPRMTRPHSGPPASAQPSSSHPDDDQYSSLPVTPPAARRPQRRRARSVPVSPTSSTAGDGIAQCSGVTKAGKRCTRQVKIGTALSDIDPDAQIERFCHQHTKEILGPTGFYSRKTGSDWIKFEDWIPDYLQLDTQAALRSEMERARSQSDVPGYIYTFEIRDPKTPDTVHLKVGRAVNLVKRIDQWGKQCGSKEQVLRGWWPGTVEDDQTSLMKGRVVAGEKGAWCHRLERLIHLELADLVKHKPYLDPHFPKNQAVPAASGHGNGRGIDKKRQCPDCGQMHKEIFSFDRVKRGHYKDKEWESIVRPIIEKWGAFVDAYV